MSNEKNQRTWWITLGASLLLASVVLHAIHFAIFKDAHHIFVYALGDIAFLPLEVLIVGLIIERLIALREKRLLRSKLNMVIGAFFSEIGNAFLSKVLPYVSNSEDLGRALSVKASWSDAEFAEACLYVRRIDFHITADPALLEELKRFLKEKRRFILELLENPNLLEHDSFTDLLWAVVHLQEELEARPSFVGLPDSDMSHLSLDIRRAYLEVAEQWVLYVQHLKNNYPYLFSLVTRTHPFLPSPAPVVTG